MDVSDVIPQHTAELESHGTSFFWRSLRQQPLDFAAWSGLDLAYSQQDLPWHAAYVHTQALRCVPSHEQSNTLPVPRPCRGMWGEGELLLTRSGPPWSGCAHVVQRLQEVLTVESDDWLSWLYLARCLELLSNDESYSESPDALLRMAVRRAIELEYLPGETGHLLAQWRLRSGQPTQALAALQAVLLQSPNRMSSWLLKAQAHMQLGQVIDGKYAFERAGQSQNPDFLSFLAGKLFQFNFGAESLSVREAVVSLRPGSVRYWLELAEIQAKLWQVERAQHSVAQALALEPENGLALQWLEDLKSAGHSRSQFDSDLAHFDAYGLKANAQGASRLLMQSLYQAHLSPEAVADLHRRVGQALIEQAKASFSADLPMPQPLPWGLPMVGNGERKTPQRRLRVGYVSGDLHRQHPVNVFMLPVLQRHDHGALEVFIYQTGTFIDEYTRQAQACADHWREAAHQSDAVLRQMIIDDRIDVLVDLAGHTATHRLGVFATRPAPVQMSYLGYPHSTGLPCIDVMLADAVVAPPEHAHMFTENLVRVSGCVFCWAPVDDYPLPAEPARPRQGPVVFSSFNNLLKVDDATAAVWARILHKCKGSRLLLKSAVLADPVVVRQTQERFAAQGIGGDRLELRGPSELSLMMQEYLDVDVALDPFPYNGGTTSLQALWMGCPMVSLEGGNFVSRMGASFLMHLGRTDWLATSEEDYVTKALALAAELRQRPWSRQAQRTAMQASGLCQIERHTSEMEAIYRQAFEGAKRCSPCA